MTGDSLYVGISDPKEIRRYVLESSKSMLLILKGYEEIKSIREEKLAVQSEYDQTMKQIMLLCNKLKKEFPEMAAKVPSANLKASVKEHAHKKAERKIEMNEIDKLEDEMKAIEGKLKGISY